MPRSEIREYQRNIEQAINRFVNSYGKYVADEHNKAIKILKREAEKMYDKFLDQFYSYKTRSYIRHGQSRPGTGNGINLYRGQQIKIKRKAHKDFNIDILDISFDGSEMESKRYQHHSADEVLGFVMDGWRFINTELDDPKSTAMAWRGSFKGEYYSSGRKKMKRAFDDFINKEQDMIFDLIKDKVKEKEEEMTKNLLQTIRRNVVGALREMF